MGQGALSKPAVQWWLSLNSSSGSRRMRSMDTPTPEGIIDEGTAEKIGGAKAHWPNIGWRAPALGPDCETGRRRARLRFGRRTGRRSRKRSD